MARNQKIGRNDPCPCGSGKKYKKCCLRRDEVRSPEPGSARREPKDQAPRSTNARLAVPPNEQIGPEAFALSAYTIARIAEDPRSAGDDVRLRKQIERSLLHDWTRKKVADMTSDEIEDQLRAYGVSHSRERFLRLAEGRTSAWSISQAWMASDPIICRGKEEDFLGLAACELWKRCLSERPSVEMIDDWMQDGYELARQEKGIEACDLWWQVWCTLRPRFRLEMSTMHAAARVFHGTQSIFNWSQDFETELLHVAQKEARFASIGRQYCAEWIAQFRGEDDSMQVSVHRSLAAFVSRLGEPERAGAILHEIVEKWPRDIWGYVALADAYARLFREDHGLPLDIGKAMGHLETGLRIPGLDKGDRRVLEDRMAKLRKRTGPGPIVP